MSRPRTPATTSDTFSDPGSLSDLESGWTDLSSNRSGGRLRTFSMNWDSTDGDDIFEERFEEETWEGILPSDNEIDGCNLDETVLLVPDSISSCPPPSVLSVSEPDTDRILAPTSPVVTGGTIDSNSSSQCSIRGSRATLRLSFPDPLSDSREDILPPNVHAKLEQTNQHAGEVDRFKHIAGSVCEDPEGTAVLEIKNSVSIIQHSSSPRFAIILLGYNPLRSLKSSVLKFVINAVATSLEGPPILANDLQLSRTFCVPFGRKLNPEQLPSESSAGLDDYIFISDRTTYSDIRPLGTLSCPTLAVVFLQPPHRYPSLPDLPANTKYLPVLLHSFGNDSISSLLDLSPSILFDNAQPSIAVPNNSLHRNEALQQCHELKILESRIDGGALAEVLTVEQLTTSSLQDFATKLTEAFFSGDTKLVEPAIGKATRLFPKLTIVFVTMFFSVLFLVTNVMKPFELLSSSFNRHTSIQGVAHPIHASLATNMAKTLGTSLIRYETKSLTSPPIIDTTTVCLPRMTSTRGVRGSSPTSIEPSHPVLTLDPPLIKALTIVPAKSIIRKFSVNTEYTIKKSDSVALRLTDALSPFFDVISKDLQDLLDAVDAFLRAVRQLQDQTTRGFCEIVDAIKQQANQGIQDLSTKIFNVAHSLGGLTFHRHTRAQTNARQMRVAGERFVSVAKQRFGARWARARGNARRVFRRGVSTGRMMLNLENDDIENSRESRRQEQEVRGNWRVDYYM